MKKRTKIIMVSFISLIYIISTFVLVCLYKNVNLNVRNLYASIFKYADKFDKLPTEIKVYAKSVLISTSNLGLIIYLSVISSFILFILILIHYVKSHKHI
jgi:hypothetical protein